MHDFDVDGNVVLIDFFSTKTILLRHIVLSEYFFLSMSETENFFHQICWQKNFPKTFFVHSTPRLPSRVVWKSRSNLLYASLVVHVQLSCPLSHGWPSRARLHAWSIFQNCTVDTKTLYEITIQLFCKGPSSFLMCRTYIWLNHTWYDMVAAWPHTKSFILHTCRHLLSHSGFLCTYTRNIHTTKIMLWYDFVIHCYSYCVYRILNAAVRGKQAT